MVTTRTNLNEKMISEELEVVRDPNEADYFICQSTIPTDVPLGKIIYVAVEPPLAEHRLYCYSQFDKFHTVICHNPDPSKDNQFPFTQTDEAQYYPTIPTSSKLPFVTRKNTKLTNRGVFYAGKIFDYEEITDSYGGVNLMKARRYLGTYLTQFPQNKIMGIGWGNQREKVNNWRVDKQQQIKNSNCDFVLAMENTMLPNYLYEKIWDGFISDKVTLYLGDPNVERHIPLDCFIDLRPYFNKETKEIDSKAIWEKLQTMSQEEYDTILENARKFRETPKRKHQELEDELTKFIIDRIK